MINIIQDAIDLYRMPDLHDSKLVRIDFGRRRLGFLFKTAGDEFFKASLINIVWMGSNNIAEENVVLDVVVLNGIEVGDDILGGLLPVKTDAQIQYVSAIRRRLSNNEIKFFGMSSSYGGEISVLCEEIEWEKLVAGREGHA